MQSLYYLRLNSSVAEHVIGIDVARVRFAVLAPPRKLMRMSASFVKTRQQVRILFSAPETDQSLSNTDMKVIGFVAVSEKTS